MDQTLTPKQDMLLCNTLAVGSLIVPPSNRDSVYLWIHYYLHGYMLQLARFSVLGEGPLLLINIIMYSID